MEHAIRHVMAEVYREHNEAEQLRLELTSLEEARQEGYRRAEFFMLNPDLDEGMDATAAYWETYFGPDKDRHHKAAELTVAKERIGAHEFSVAALSAALIQYAKQGIALRYGRHRTGIPHGRVIADLTLHDIIWQARNQALHWEDGTFHKSVDDCFQVLAERVDTTFADYKNRNMAFNILRLLEWTTFENLEKDLLSLDP